ncbi:hypothetical protein PG996_008447 [Apiospora saccharicola]|uniref:Uncharacterized protein n=1 Tax=Apiospora saccharicola TaxID=335842 RepID=A0ABR1UXZ3_9PEZI
MAANADGTRRFTHRVVAVRDDTNDEEMGLNSLELGNAFDFVAYYTPPATILFRLSLSLANEMTFYLQYPPQVISSLKKTTCDEKNERNRPPCFPAVKNHLGCRSFARLQFKLHGPGQLITPAGFALGDFKDIKLRRTFTLAASLAAASAFSLYLPRDALTNREYNAFSDVHKQWPVRTADQNAELERMMDLQKMYKGKGGALFGREHQDRLFSLEAWATGADVDAGPPPSYSKYSSGKLPEYDGREPSSIPLLPESLTASESDAATVAHSRAL